MVAFLKKPVGSDDFHEIEDFLKRYPLRYALTHNPTIYDSLIKQFWQTATVRTLANGIQVLVASIDNKKYIITKVSIRSSLQLADAAGIHNLLDAEIHEGLATIGMSPKSGGWDQFGSTIATTLICASTDQGKGSAIPADPHPTPSDPICWVYRRLVLLVIGYAANNAHEATTTSVEVEAEGATTTTTGLDAGLDIGNIHKSPLMSHEAPVHEGHTSRSAEDNLQLKELMEIVPKLVNQIGDLEKELHQTKNTYGKAVLTLVERVKLLEMALKRKSKKMVVSDSEGEEPEDQRRKI
ncbi:hypothetical protein Tco_0170069 [Tanacetum coccineum]